ELQHFLDRAASNQGGLSSQTLQEALSKDGVRSFLEDPRHVAALLPLFGVAYGQQKRAQDVRITGNNNNLSDAERPVLTLPRSPTLSGGAHVAAAWSASAALLARPATTTTITTTTTTIVTASAAAAASHAN
ncbi:unnamed protein product, partial [Polarella glacialis]